MIVAAGTDLLAQIAREVAAEWGRTLGQPLRGSCHAYVAPVGEDAVLKVTAREADEADEEADALLLWDGNGAVRLLRRDPGSRAMLLERARPGTDISALPDQEATAIAVAIGRRL